MVFAVAKLGHALVNNKQITLEVKGGFAPVHQAERSTHAQDPAHGLTFHGHDRSCPNEENVTQI